MAKHAKSRLHCGALRAILHILTRKGAIAADSETVFPAYRLVAQFADGTRAYFDGLTEAQAEARMEAAQKIHGDISWYDGVTDVNYEGGKYHAMIPPPPCITIIDLTEYDENAEENDEEE